ncbi:Pyridoxamine 5'-phosphate oxidase [hydrothermal vent metagenome]|uniref:Pyridoxamine 5'-phosphate oxidase n=1 Tax=hydrothermal vent metagenome TaxID=652676 RepID=A0A3B1E0P8_9ZZZZ
MTSLGPFDAGPSLPEPLPESPFPLFQAWFDEAHERMDSPNPNAMTLATAGPGGKPSARVVLCKGINIEAGTVDFYTNLHSRKGREIEENPLVAVVFHWDTLERQVRMEGRVSRVSDAEADAYFATRAWQSRIGAWASAQSEPLASREDLLEQATARILELDIDIAAAMRGDPVDIPRPPFWGGYRLRADWVELWVGGTGRMHDRAAWERVVDGGSGAGGWRGQRLQP